MQSLIPALPILLEAFGQTVLLSFLVAVLAAPLGALLAGSTRANSTAVRWIAIAYIDLVRGIPVLVFLFIVYFILPTFGIILPKFTSAIIALSLYFSGFVAEILRGAIASIPRGQFHAAIALGMLPRQMDYVVVYPQAIRIALPSLMNLSAIVIKATSVVSIIGVWELMAASREIVARTMLPFQLFMIALLLYFVLCFGIVQLAAQLEKRYAAAYK